MNYQKFIFILLIYIIVRDKVRNSIPPKVNHIKSKKSIIFELRPSTIHGIGVFATAKLAKGILLPLFEDDDHRFIPMGKVKTLGISLKQMRIHSIEYPEGFSAPKNFNRMSVGWYLNHSDTPNAYHDENYFYYALRQINKDEEITIDYNSL